MTLLNAVMAACDVDQDEAETMIQEMKTQVIDGGDPEELLYDIGLEPDYVIDLIEF